MSKLFTVFGATGQQGGALITYLLNHPRFSKTFKLRGITRDASKPSAKKLEEQGVEMVEGDMDKPESLKTATEGSYAVFAVTNYWDKASAAVEVAQGKAIADAAVGSGAEILIWSSLPRIGLPNFDSKADVEVYIRTLPIKAVFFMPGWFMQNQLSFARPRKADNGYVFEKPWPTVDSNVLVPLIDIKDIGKYVQPFLDDPDKYNQTSLTASTAFYPPDEMCDTWTKVTGHEVTFAGKNETESGGLSGPIVAGDSIYYGDGSRKSLEWTLAQMEEAPTSWEKFVKDHEPWFE